MSKEWEAQADDFGYWGVYDKEGNCIAEAAEPGNCYLEDIQLMAAAPEMKDLLKAAAPYASIMDDDFEGVDGGRAGALFDAIIALLRRIEGEGRTE